MLIALDAADRVVTPSKSDKSGASHIYHREYDVGLRATRIGRRIFVANAEISGNVELAVHRIANEGMTLRAYGVVVIPSQRRVVCLTDIGRAVEEATVGTTPRR